MAPGRSPARMPLGPVVIAASAASSVTMLNTTSAAAATFRGVSRQISPWSMSVAALALLRLVPYTRWPSSRRSASGAPMAPRPTNPMVVMALSSLGGFDVGDVLVGQLDAGRGEDRVDLFGAAEADD